MPPRIREAVPGDARSIAEIHVRAWQAAYRGQLTDDYLDGLSVEDRLEQHRQSLEAPPAEWRTWVAEGNGPVNALDRALRAAIADRYPHLADIELTNYKVRILDETHGTGAVTRVLLDSSDGDREWGTIGVSENIIEASWEALVDSLEYAFQPRGKNDGG